MRGHADAIAQRQPPGQRVCQANADKPQRGGHRQRAAERAAQQFAHAAEHGVQAVPHTLQRVAEDHQAAVDAEQCADDGKVLHRKRRGLAFAGAKNQRCERPLAEKQRRPGRRAVDPLDAQPGLDAGPDAVIPARAVVLAGIGCHSHADAFHRQRKHLADLLAGGLPRNRRGAQ